MATATATERNLVHRSALAYIGLYGLAYDRLTSFHKTNCVFRNGQFDNLIEKGEVVEKQAEVLMKESRLNAMKRYSEATGFVSDTVGTISNLIPFGRSTKVATLEAEIANLTAKLDAMSQTAQSSPKTTAKTRKRKVKTTTNRVVKAATKVTKQAVAETIETPNAATAQAAHVKPVEAKAVEAKKEPRHIPYFVDVKRYDPLANEDIVRKIVNHCGIALRSEDARYVACSDESERTTVRESWLKRKLGIEALDTDLDKKVLEVCSIMQRDQKKNRVTFYYLLAKKERLLDTI